MEKKEYFLGKVTLAEIRKAYFANKLTEIINKIQGEDELTEEKTTELYNYLEKLANEGREQTKKIIDTFGGKEVENKPPSVEELREGTEYSQEDEEKAKKVVAYVEGVFSSTRQAINNKQNIPPKYWLDTTATLISYSPILFAYYIFKHQSYFGRLTDIKDKTNCSRLEAENRAKLTKEYAEYKNLQHLVGDTQNTGLMERFENLSKKYDAKN